MSLDSHNGNTNPPGGRNGEGRPSPGGPARPEAVSILLILQDESNRRSTRPTFQSMFSHIARAARVIASSSRFPSRSFIFGSSDANFAYHRSGTCIGEWGVFSGR